MHCRMCPLCEGRNNIVEGHGPIPSNIMIIGEAPGRNEDKLGRPFVGKAGNILDELLASIALHRSDVYITNVVKCRPPKNRDPTKEEIATCSHHLEDELRLVKPKLIITLGRYSMKYIFDKFGIDDKNTIGYNHGMVKHYNGITIIPMYHPAAVIYRPHLRNDMLSDWSTVKAYV